MEIHDFDFICLFSVSISFDVIMGKFHLSRCSERFDNKLIPQNNDQNIIYKIIHSSLNEDEQ